MPGRVWAAGALIETARGSFGQFLGQTWKQDTEGLRASGGETYGRPGSSRLRGYPPCRRGQLRRMPRRHPAGGSRLRCRRAPRLRLGSPKKRRAAEPGVCCAVPRARRRSGRRQSARGRPPSAPLSRRCRGWARSARRRPRGNAGLNRRRRWRGAAPSRRRKVPGCAPICPYPCPERPARAIRRRASIPSYGGGRPVHPM